MAAARAAEGAFARGEDFGPLHGIPVALKDVFYWKGRKTTSNSRVMLDFEADEDAGVLTRLKEGGAVLWASSTPTSSPSAAGPRPSRPSRPR